MFGGIYCTTVCVCGSATLADSETGQVAGSTTHMGYKKYVKCDGYKEDE